MTTDEMIARAETGEPIKAIAEAAGIRFDAVYKRLHRAGFKPTGLWQPRVRVPSNEYDLAYMAGLIDADGSICRTCRGWAVEVGMTDEATIHWLAQFGGTVNDYQPAGNRKHVWQWVVARRRDVVALVAALLPHLITKHSQAKACLTALN